MQNSYVIVANDGSFFVDQHGGKTRWTREYPDASTFTTQREARKHLFAIPPNTKLIWQPKIAKNYGMDS